MSLLINQNLLKHREVGTANLNNLCTIMHKLPAEGVYYGQVYAGRNPLGSFVLTYDKANPEAQAHIDLSAFDTFIQINLNKKPVDANAPYAVGQDGIVVFFISGAQKNLHATVTHNGKKVYDTRKLQKGDAAVFRLVNQGNYALTDEEGHRMTVTVKAAENNKYPDLRRQEAVNVTLTADGFSPSKEAINPLQILVVGLEVNASLNLTGAKEPL
ncbi:MAG TPA: hypothetical protein VGN20_27660 [Mucilaginibacter sp.]|jgi:hypothetical protein